MKHAHELSAVPLDPSLYDLSLASIVKRKEFQGKQRTLWDQRILHW